MHYSCYSNSETMTFTFKCYQNNFMINNLNIVSFGDCFGSIVTCMAFAFLIELSRGIDLYLRHYSVTGKNDPSNPISRNLSPKTIRKRRFFLHLLRTLVRLAQTTLSYILMLMIMNDFAGFLFSAVIALGIGYYLMNGVHPSTMYHKSSMASVTLPRRAHQLRSIREHRNHHSYQGDADDLHSCHHYPGQTKLTKSVKALSHDEPETQFSLPASPTATHNKRIKDLCSRFKRRLLLTKESRTRSVDVQNSPSERRIVRFDFEQVYDTIPSCLINALPGPDDYLVSARCQNLSDSLEFQTDPTDECSVEQMNLFAQCQRGKFFRRNAICHKLDKSQYNSQLDTFVQQLMVEKLMRTWT
ncbi:unnamed protein product [Adineta ricciae]|uniref:Copper transport protein n=1 Tax=Adineta ricciae TaxID=249248 RepID=A0A813R4R8_ADIRI|nr:unnamed protein product [Adineta ricciae]